MIGKRSKAEASQAARLAPGRWATWPTVGYLILTTQIPLLATVYFSLHSWNLLYPGRGMKFVGLSNYSAIFTDPVFQTAIGNTIIFTIVPAVLTTLIGLGLALLVNRLKFGRGLAYSLLFAPFLIMETVNPIIWKNLILNPIYGLLNFALGKFGLPAIDMITTAPKVAIIIMIVWQWSPFMMLILLAGLQSVNHETVEAAQIDGARGWSQFWHILLPHLIPFIAVGMLIEAILILPVFGPIYVGTYGGPGNQTVNLMFSVYRTLTEQYAIGRAAAGGIVTAIMTTVVASMLLIYIRPYMERE